MFFGDREASVQGHARRIASSAREHQRHAQGRLKMHLLELRRERRRRAREAPAPTSDDIRSAETSPRKTGAAAAASPTPISALPLAPKHHSKAARTLLRRGKVRRPFRPGRQGRPFGPGLLQPSPVISRVAHGQVGELGVVDADFEGVSARRVQQPVAHHRPDGTGRDHRLGDEAVDGAKNERLDRRSRWSRPPAPHRA